MDGDSSKFMCTTHTAQHTQHITNPSHTQVSTYGQELEVDGDSSKFQELQQQRAQRRASSSSKDTLSPLSSSSADVEPVSAASRPSTRSQGGLFQQHIPRTVGTENA